MQKINWRNLLTRAVIVLAPFVVQALANTKWGPLADALASLLGLTAHETALRAQPPTGGGQA